MVKKQKMEQKDKGLFHFDSRDKELEHITCGDWYRKEKQGRVPVLCNDSLMFGPGFVWRFQEESQRPRAPSE
jgi:hypothetical protein